MLNKGDYINKVISIAKFILTRYKSFNILLYRNQLAINTYTTLLGNL